MIRRVSKGGLTHLFFFLSSNIGLEFYAKSEVTQDLGPIPCHWRVSKGGLTHLLFFLSSNISLDFYAKFERQRFLETGDVSRLGTNSV